MAGGRAGNPRGRQWGRRDGNIVRGEQGPARAHWAGLEPESVLTFDEVGVLQKLTGGLCHGAESSPGPDV